MWRQVHRWPAVVFGLLLIFLSFTGSILAIDPVLRRFDRHVLPLGDVTVGDVLRLSAVKTPNFAIDRIRVDYSGRVMLRGADGGGSRDVPINLETGRLGRVDRASPLMDLVRRLHSTLNIGPTARLVTLAGSATMLVLLVSGAVLLTRRLGGLRKTLLTGRIRGRGADKWHTVLGRLMVLPLFVTVFSGTWMALTTQGVIPAAGSLAAMETKVEPAAEAMMVAARDLAVFDQFKLADLTELTFPIASDWWDVYTIRLGRDLTYIDRYTGDILGTASVPFWTQALDLFTVLHTGQGASVWGAVAGLAALSVPFFTVTGLLVWLRRRHPHVQGMVRAGVADVVILVGSETGTTWGFAAHLAERLHAKSLSVFLGAMNSTYVLKPDARLLILAATYGDGAPPVGAAQFLTRLPFYKGGNTFAVLGFGDKSFPAYCAFADACDAALRATGRRAILDIADVNKRSGQAFATWGRSLGPAIGLPDLLLDYTPPRPATRKLLLIDRQDFGAKTAAPAAILRFQASGKRLRLPRFQAGDLMAILPPDDPVARLYSLASSSREGFVDLCIAQVEGGICSTHLLGLALGATVDAYVQPNPDFRPATKKPTIMIGAGTGIAPFMGMIRGNSKRHPMDLFFGLRHPDSDFYWQGAISDWQANGALSAFYPAFSRHDGQTYVQDRLRETAPSVAARLRAGGTVMVCGSVRMAQAVAHEIETIARSLGTSVAELKASGRYLEDVY